MEELPEPRPAYVLTRGRYDAPKTEDKRVTRATTRRLAAVSHECSIKSTRPRHLAHRPSSPRSRLASRSIAAGKCFLGAAWWPRRKTSARKAPSRRIPKLLDWLARDFIKSGWDTKALLKKIVLSATYRQDSKLRPDLRQRDPENLLLARGPSQRLPAEMIRDAALAASGLLDERLGGPPVSPYMPGDLWRESNSMSPAYHQSVGGDLYRRSLYTVCKRTAPMPDMLAFDAPSREVCVVRRSATATPQQAFVLLNDVQFVEAARMLAQSALKRAVVRTNKSVLFFDD